MVMYDMDMNFRAYLAEIDNYNIREKKTGDFYLGPRHPIVNPQTLPSVSSVINESSHITGIEIPRSKQKDFDLKWLDVMKKLFVEKHLSFQKYEKGGANSNPTVKTDLDYFLEDGFSNGRPLFLQIMVCPPDKCFKLHAHPNIESMLTLKGSLHELRAIGPPIESPSFYIPAPGNESGDHTEKNECDDIQMNKGSDERKFHSKIGEVIGPSIPFSTFFEKKCTVKGQMIVNEIGSVHQSYTTSRNENYDDGRDEGNGVSMLVLWSGCHANTPSSKVFCRDARLNLFCEE